MSDVFDVSEFYSQLEQKQASQPRDENSNGPRLKKIFLNAPPNHGTITILPFQDPISKLFYTYFDKDTEKVKEFKIYNEANEDDKWMKIIPKKLLGDLSPEDEALYNEVKSMWSHEYDKEDENGWKYIREKAYTLVYGYVVSHFNKENKPVEGSAGSMALIVIPSALFAYKQRTNIDQVKTSANGDISWLGHILNNNLDNRQAYLRVSFLPAANGAIGYDLGVSHEFNNPGSPVGMVVPADLKLSDDQLKLFSKGHVADFMGWQSGDTTLFNKNLYVDMRKEFNQRNGVVLASNPEVTLGVNPVDTIVQAPPAPIDPSGIVNPIPGFIPPVAPVPTPPIPGFPVPGVPVQ